MPRTDFGTLTAADVDQYRAYHLTKYTYDQVKPIYDACKAVEIEMEAMNNRIDQLRAHFDKDSWDFVTFPKELAELIDLQVMELFGMFADANTCEKFPLSVWKKNASQIKKAMKKAAPLIAAVEWWVFMDSNQPEDFHHTERVNKQANTALNNYFDAAKWYACEIFKELVTNGETEKYAAHNRIYNFLQWSAFMEAN